MSFIKQSLGGARSRSQGRLAEALHERSFRAHSEALVPEHALVPVRDQHTLVPQHALMPSGQLVPVEVWDLTCKLQAGLCESRLQSFDNDKLRRLSSVKKLAQEELPKLQAKEEIWLRQVQQAPPPVTAVSSSLADTNQRARMVKNLICTTHLRQNRRPPPPISQLQSARFQLPDLLHWLFTVLRHVGAAPSCPDSVFLQRWS